jgi:hypothetical protein
MHEGENLHIWTVPAYILNKQSWTPNNGQSSSLGVVQGVTTPLNKSYSQST